MKEGIMERRKEGGREGMKEGKRVGMRDKKPEMMTKWWERRKRNGEEEKKREEKGRAGTKKRERAVTRVPQICILRLSLLSLRYIEGLRRGSFVVFDDLRLHGTTSIRMHSRSFG